MYIYYLSTGMAEDGALGMVFFFSLPSYRPYARVKYGAHNGIPSAFHEHAHTSTRASTRTSDIHKLVWSQVTVYRAVAASSATRAAARPEHGLNRWNGRKIQKPKRPSSGFYARRVVFLSPSTHFSTSRSARRRGQLRPNGQPRKTDCATEPRTPDALGRRGGRKDRRPPGMFSSGCSIGARSPRGYRPRQQRGGRAAY